MEHCHMGHPGCTEPCKLTSLGVLQNLEGMPPGKQVVVDVLAFRCTECGYPSETERDRVRQEVSRLLTDSKGLVFQKRVVSGCGQACFLQVFVSASPEALTRLTAAVKRWMVATDVLLKPPPPPLKVRRSRTPSPPPTLPLFDPRKA